jgi:heptosyltransferase-2
MLGEIKHCAYDTALSFEQGSLAGTAFLRATGIPRRAGFASGSDRIKGALLTHGLGFQSDSSMWQSFLSLARLIDPGLANSLMPLPLALTDEQLRLGASWLRERIPRAPGRPAVFHLGSGAGQPFKRWAVPKFAMLAQKLRDRDRNLSIILTGLPNERDLMSQFCSLYDGSVIDATDLRSIAMTASVLSHCGLLVSNDTGVMHLGAAMGVPTVGLFGATTPLQWGPAGRAAVHVYATEVKCSPCIDSFLNRVPVHCANPDYGRCMTDVSVEAVLEAATMVAGAWLNC